MKRGIYAIRDRVAECFQSVTVDVNDGTAKRNFAFAVNNSDNMLFSAKDLELYRIGEFNYHSGSISPVTPAVLICRADEVIAHD